MESPCRYRIRVRFNLVVFDNGKGLPSHQIGLDEPVKTLREAREYKGIVDESVSEAYVFDNVSKSIAERWK